MRKVLAALLVLSFVFAIDTPVFAGLGSDKAEYVGGTINTIPEGTEGSPSAKDEKAFVFDYKKGKLTIPYERIDALEYGQKAGRRVGLAIAISPLALFSKKRRHFLTISYKDDAGKQQAAVFELGKNTVRTTLATLEARSGRKIDYQDDEARKSGRGN